MTRVLLLHNIMAPYRYPLFAALARQPTVDLTVWFMSESARNRRWESTRESPGFTYDVLPRIELSYARRDLFTYIVNYSFPLRYASNKFDVLICAGWLDFACQTGFALSKLLRRKYILWSESTANEPSWRRTLAQPLVKTMVQHADACLAVGTRSREYLVDLGAQPRKVFTAISTVDVALFQRVSAEWRPRRRELRDRFGIQAERVVLYVGQFIERKGLRCLLDAFEHLVAAQPDTALVLVGYGPLEQELREIVTSRALTDVHFIGHVEVGEMPRMYAMADVFVLPSFEETWGLVVNEAMACGLPVIVSDRVGSSVDLVRDGANGYVVPAGDSAALADRLAGILRDAEALERMGRCSAERIGQCTPDQAAAEFANAIQYVRGRG